MSQYSTGDQKDEPGTNHWLAAGIRREGNLGPTFAYRTIVQATGAEALMAKVCQECGAPLPEGGKCIDHFHALLLLEYEVVADPAIANSERGLIAHFYAVSSYVLQHPEGMNYTAQALAEARRGLGEHLAGKVTLSEQRRRVRRESHPDNPPRRRPGRTVAGQLLEPHRRGCAHGRR